MNRFTRAATGSSAIRERLAKRTTEPRVTLAELEEECSLPPGSAFTKLAALGVKIAGDWAGRPSVSLEDAARVFVKVTGDLAVDAQKWQRYQQYVEERQQRLQEVRTRAAAAAREGVAGTPQQESAAQQARIRAEREFDAAEPLIPFEQYRGGDGQ
jgi:hypothetical protein